MKKLTHAPFIVFEGGEGCGKTSQSRRIGDYLRANGYNVLNTRAPGGTPSAEEIRALLVTGAADRWTKDTEILLFTAARVEHVERLIWPTLESGTAVICDRFIDSTLAYQANGNMVLEGTILDLHDTFARDLFPDLTILLDIDPEIGLARSTKRLTNEVSQESRFEAMELEFHQRQRAVFQRLAAAEPHRYLVIDATKPMDEIFEIIREKLESGILDRVKKAA